MIAIKTSLLSLPSTMEWGSVIPLYRPPEELSASIRICSPNLNKLIAGEFDYDYDCECNQANAKASDIRKDRMMKE